MFLWRVVQPGAGEKSRFLISNVTEFSQKPFATLQNVIETQNTTIGILTGKLDNLIAAKHVERVARPSRSARRATAAIPPPKPVRQVDHAESQDATGEEEKLRRLICELRQQNAAAAAREARLGEVQDSGVSYAPLRYHITVLNAISTFANTS